MMKSFLIGLLALRWPTVSKRDVAGPASNIAPVCRQYNVLSNDTCLAICSKSKVTYAQLLSWNPSLNPQCSYVYGSQWLDRANDVQSNLDALDGGHLCISNPVANGSYIISSNTHGLTSIATTTALVPSPTLAGTASTCAQYYKILSGDTCAAVTLEFDITLKDFLFLNTDLRTNCTNLQKDVYYCVKPVGYISTYPGYGAPATKPFIQTPATAIPYAGKPFENLTSSAEVIPLANKTRLDCYSYFVVQNLTDNLAADCWNLAFAYGVTPEELILWNPSLGKVNKTTTSATASALAVQVASINPFATSTTTADYNYPCTVAANSSYCVALVSPTAAPTGSTVPPSPRAAGEAADCKSWVAARKFSSCEWFCNLYHLTHEEFYALNPSVGKDCAKLILGTYYCVSNPQYPPEDDEDDTTISVTATSTGSNVATPSPIKTGISSSCTRFYKVQPGDSCYDIANNNNIPLSSFYTWNPAVRADCTGLQADVYVCIGASTGTVTPTFTSTVPKGGITTPTPTQDGMTSHCDGFYKVQPEDGCWKIANDAKIELTQFYSWNPAVGSGCSALQPGYYVCISAQSSQTTTPTTPATAAATPTPIQEGMVKDCKIFYKVQTGDGCYDIAHDKGITVENFYLWNPAVRTDCSGLQANVFVCVGT